MRASVTFICLRSSKLYPIPTHGRSSWVNGVETVPERAWRDSDGLWTDQRMEKPTMSSSPPWPPATGKGVLEIRLQRRFSIRCLRVSTTCKNYHNLKKKTPKIYMICSICRGQRKESSQCGDWNCKQSCLCLETLKWGSSEELVIIIVPVLVILGGASFSR